MVLAAKKNVVAWFVAGILCGGSALALAASPGDAAGIRWIKLKGGFYNMGCVAGSEGCDEWEQPAHQVTLESFEIAKSEVTVKQYQTCVTAGACTAPHWDDKVCLVKNGPRWEVGVLPASFRKDDLPITCVDYSQALAFAAWVGGRLPSEAEWEFAARSRGNEKNIYPWGKDKPDCAKAVYHDAGPKGDGKAGCGQGGPSCCLCPPQR